MPGSPAALAGIGSGAQLVAVNSRAFSPDVLGDAMTAAKESGAPIELLVKSADFFTTHKLAYRAGERHPHLVRDEAKTDVLSLILAPRTWQAPEAKEAAKP